MGSTRLFVVSAVYVRAGPHARFVGVVGDVSPQVLVLFEAVNEVIKGLLLPELAFLTNCLVDLERGVVKPRVALVFHCVGASKCGD